VQGQGVDREDEIGGMCKTLEKEKGKLKIEGRSALNCIVER
jgi:hypothetical protein